MTFLYNCKSEIDKDGATHYRITKFDEHMDVESSYLTDGKACGCPAGERRTCRHREMLPRFIARGVVNTEWFYDFDRGGWVQMGEEWSVTEPVDEPLRAQHGPTPAEPVEQDEYLEGIITREPHSVAVSTPAFEAVSDGSNPSEATRPKGVFIRRRL